MIKKFNQYNESIRGEMKPKSEEEIKSGVDGYVKNIEKKLKDMLVDEDEGDERMDYAYDIFEMLEDLYGLETHKDTVKLLIEEDFINADEIYESVLDKLNQEWYINNSSKPYTTKLLDIIKKKKD